MAVREILSCYHIESLPDVAIESLAQRMYRIQRTLKSEADQLPLKLSGTVSTYNNGRWVKRECKVKLDMLLTYKLKPSRHLVNTINLNTIQVVSEIHHGKEAEFELIIDLPGSDLRNSKSSGSNNTHNGHHGQSKSILFRAK